MPDHDILHAVIHLPCHKLLCHAVPQLRCFLSKIGNFLIFFGFFRPTQKMSPDGPKWGREVIFPANPDLADILGRTGFDFENLYFLDFFGFQISGLGPAWAHPLGPGLGPPTWAQLGPGLGPPTCHSITFQVPGDLPRPSLFGLPPPVGIWHEFKHHSTQPQGSSDEYQ